VEKDLRNEHVLALAAQMAAFVEAAPSIRDVHVHIIPGPVFESDAASATFVSNHIFVEWIATAHPKAIPSLALHELTHYFYDTASAAKHVSLMQQFAQAEIPYASALYAFLNEALACAVQGLVAERTPQSGEANSDKDVYRHAFIPRLGRSTVPVLKDSLVKRSTLYQGFTQPYIRAANVELGPDITNPKFFLTSAAILPTDRGTKAYEIFLEEVQPVSFIRSDQWKLFPNLNLVFMVAYDELAGFSGLSSDIASHTNRRGFAFMDSRDGKAIVCVIAGRDAGAITDVVKAFVKLPSVPPSGLVLSID